MQWKTTRDDSVNFRYNRTRGGIQAVSDSSNLESRFAVLENMMKGQFSNNPHLSKLPRCDPNAMHCIILFAHALALLTTWPQVKNK